MSLTDSEISRIAAFKEITERAFIENFTRLKANRLGLALLDKPNHECVFLQGGDCSVQPVKPQQCRDFPNLWNFPGFEKVCQAIPKLVVADEYKRLVSVATGRPAESLDSFDEKLPV